jgi:dihydropteroate synthase
MGRVKIGDPDFLPTVESHPIPTALPMVQHNALTQPVDKAQLQALDDKLSQRFIDLDPGGYFLIYLDLEQGLICAEHFANTINDKGLACDPETGEPLPCGGDLKRAATRIYTGRTAKELCITIFEDASTPCPITYLDHAAYLGREFIRAEAALVAGEDYIQD